MKKILIAEDDYLLGDLLVKKFELSGNECKVILKGAEVVPAAEAFGPDVILLDLNLPDIDGFKVMELLKANDATGKIPVIILSNDRENSHKARAEKLGAVLYLEKAVFDLDEIEKKVNEIIP